MSVVRSTALARSSPPSADERLATGGPSGRRGAGGSCANVPFSGTVNARGSREAMSIRMARKGVGGPDPSPTRDRARHASPVVPTRRFGVRHECAFDDRHRGDISRVTTARRRASVPYDRGDASARRGDATASCEATRVRERARLCRQRRGARPRASSGSISARTRPLAKKNAAKRRRKIQLANCGVRESRAFGGSGLEATNTRRAARQHVRRKKR
jgi:hypothetical protein